MALQARRVCRRMSGADGQAAAADRGRKTELHVSVELCKRGKSRAKQW
jgi:hypothetical protein